MKQAPFWVVIPIGFGMMFFGAEIANTRALTRIWSFIQT